jgi:eukaryotic-like serine/threonine-protein kinase
MRLSEHFDALTELSERERNAQIAQIRLENAKLADQLTELFVEEAEAAALEPEAMAQHARDAMQVISAKQIQVERLRPIKLIGAGGMGEVWMAERTLGRQTQIVALKVLKAARLTVDFRARFEEEQKALMKLAHPNIAQLLDAGVTKDGLPWLAMEFVQGHNIVEYCDVNHLTVRDRIALFQQLLSAVQYAHDNLLVHRDIKPENVLVNAAGQVKLLDFGIAKSLQSNVKDTATGLGFFSLYAPAPEQLLEEAISVRTDIYSLGGLLYELLSGVGLLTRKSMSPTQIEQLIVHESPVGPSQRAEESSASARQLDRRGLRKALSGDLDRIVLHALRKKPGERYASARAFSDDLEAHLDHRPVIARGQNFGYRAGKFVRRNWVALSASAAAVVTLAYLGVQLVFANQSLETQTQQALVAKDRAEKTTQFMLDVFSAANPEVNGGVEPTAADLSNIATQFFEERAQLDGNEIDTLTPALIDVQLGLGNEQNAIDLATVWLNKQPALSPERAEALLKRAQAFHANGILDSAASDLQTLDQEFMALMSSEQKSRKALLEGKLLFHNIKDASAAFQKFSEAEITLKKSANIDVNWRAEIITQQARALSYVQEHERAQQLLVQLMASLPKEKSSSVAQMRVLATQAMVARRSGLFAQEVGFAEQANQLAEQLFGKEHKQSAKTLNTLGVAYRYAGKIELSIATLRRAVDRMQAAALPHDPEQIGPLINLASTTNNLVEKRESYERALRVIRQDPLLEQNVGVMVRKQLLQFAKDRPAVLSLKSELCQLKQNSFCVEAKN